MAACKSVPGFHPHRICQARELVITILGNTTVPVQVDGEPWLQQPGVVRISFKNQVEMLRRDRGFEQRMHEWQPAAEHVESMLESLRLAVIAVCCCFGLARACFGVL